jgi:hypothetical protein
VCARLVAAPIALSNACFVYRSDFAVTLRKQRRSPPRSQAEQSRGRLGFFHSLVSSRLRWRHLVQSARLEFEGVVQWREPLPGASYENAKT